MIRPTEFNLMASVNVICFQCALSDLHWLTILHRRGGYKLRHTPPQRRIQTQAHSTKTPTITHNASHTNKERHISHKKGTDPQADPLAARKHRRLPDYLAADSSVTFLAGTLPALHLPIKCGVVSPSPPHRGQAVSSLHCLRHPLKHHTRF